MEIGPRSNRTPQRQATAGEGAYRNKIDGVGAIRCAEKECASRWGRPRQRRTAAECATMPSATNRHVESRPGNSPTRQHVCRGGRSMNYSCERSSTVRHNTPRPSHARRRARTLTTKLRRICPNSVCQSSDPSVTDQRVRGCGRRRDEHARLGENANANRDHRALRSRLRDARAQGTSPGWPASGR